jgi:hypothetical protein
VSKRKGSKGSVTHIQLTTASALRIVQRLAKKSSAVAFTTHASSRMRQRKVTRLQVLECLLKGHIVEGPAPGIKGNWELKMRRAVYGDDIEVVVALDWHAESADYVLVVTVIRN